MHVYRVRVSARTYHVVAVSLNAAITRATQAAARDGVRDPDVSAVRRLGKAVR